MYETNGTYAILFTYDYDGTLISFNYDANVLDAINGTEYFYIRNQLGDITHLVDSTGVVSVHYLYDAYGTITYQTPSQSIGEINPYRYRGYRYDEELSWYYLNSRYYSADTGRFLNSDGLLGEFGSILSTNMYAYCANNPVMYTDGDGDFPVLIFIGITIVTLAAVYGSIKAYNTATSLGSEGWELVGYTVSGLLFGDYLPVRDNWDSISDDIEPYDDETDQYINFNFNRGNNTYYSIYTAGIFSKYLKENIYTDFSCRTNIGMYLEIQAHYIFDKILGNFYENGNPAMLGDTATDSTAKLFEDIAKFIYDFGSCINGLNESQ